MRSVRGRLRSLRRRLPRGLTFLDRGRERCRYDSRMRWWIAVLLAGCATVHATTPAPLVCAASPPHCERPAANFGTVTGDDWEPLPPELEALLASAQPVVRTLPFPTPPMQGQPWVLPDDTDPALVEWLHFVHGPGGMPDPRGCELRWVVLTVGTNAGPDTLEVVTTAWVLPRASDDDAAFAIAWNGVMYQAAAVGDEVSLEDALTRTSSALAENAADREHPRFAGWLVRSGNGRELSTVTMPRVGLGGLVDAPTADIAPCLDVRPCAAIAAMEALGVAIGAQARGDDVLALAAIRQAMRLRDAAPIDDDPSYAEDVDRLTGWDVLDPLNADLERRATEPLDLAARDAAIARPLEHRGWLLSELDEIGVAQTSWPGGAGFSSDPIAESVLAIGPDVVLPLLDATEDDRLVRGVSFHRPFFPGRHVHAVCQVAVPLALLAIERHLPWMRTDDCVGRRDEVVECLRARFAETPTRAADGWLALLASDTPNRWAEAARRLARAPRVRCNDAPSRPPLHSPTLDDWRECTAPVNELDADERDALRSLLLRRVDESLARAAGPDETPSCNLGMALLAVPGPGVIDAMRRMSHACEAQRQTCACETELTVARHLLGDETALPEWSARLRELRPGRSGIRTERLAPGWLFPERVDVQETIRNVLAERPHSDGIGVGPVLGSPAIREWIVAGLERDEVIGEWVIDSVGCVSATPMYGLPRCHGEPVTRFPRRRSEAFADELSYLRNDANEGETSLAPLPRFDVDPDESRRRASIEAMIDAVQSLPWGPHAGPSALSVGMANDCVLY